MSPPTSTNVARRALRAAPDALAIGALTPTGGFVPTQLLHSGRWSRVYRARPVNDDAPNRDAVSNDAAEAGPYALKIPIAGEDREQTLLAENMLRREAWIMRSVSQPNVMPLLGFQLKTRPYHLLMPYLEGATLEDVFDAGLRLPLPHALWVARQIAQGLEALHAAGWRHGDIRPANIHVAPSGHATLLDFGLAQRLMSTTPHRRAALAGTLSYAAPEQFRRAAPLDARSDLYSLGAVFYQMLAGRPPFVKPNAASLMAAHLDEPPPAPPLPPGRIAADVRELTARLLAKEPLRRPQSARELAARLRRLEIAALSEITWAASCAAVE